jgi:hypothetical protein
MDYYMHAWSGGMGDMGMGLGFPAMLVPLVLIAAVWTFAWKGLALWHSARKQDIWWFIAFLFVNTLGILEIVYLFGFRGMKLNDLFKSHYHPPKE